MNRRIVLLVALCMIAVSPLFSQPTAEASKGYEIGISKMVSHPALDSIEQGIMDYLNGTGMQFNFDLQNCNAEIATAIAIAQKFKSDNKDLVVGIATPPAQALAQVITD